MKFYYYCMKSSFRECIVTIKNMLIGKPRNDELEALQAEEIKLFEITECPVSSDIIDVFYFTDFCMLHKDGHIENAEKPIPPIKRAEHISITRYPLYLGNDERLYDDTGSVLPDGTLYVTPNGFVVVKEEKNMLRLQSRGGNTLKIPLTRLKEMNSQPVRYTWEYVQKHYQELTKDLVEVKSKKIFCGSDGTCLFDWNGLIYSISYYSINDCIHHNYDNYKDIYDATYHEEYEAIIDDIMELVTDKIYINRKNKLVFLPGWDNKVEEIAIKAQKWENLTHCEIFNKHLIAKTKDGRILSTFDNDICGNLKNIDHAFVRYDYAFFVIK